MNLADLLFYLFAAVTLGGAAAVAFSRSILYSALGLLAALTGAGALYALLGADFLAVTQLLVYVGGVVVLVLFAVMLTRRIGEADSSNPSAGLKAGAGLLAVLTPVLLVVAVAAPWPERAALASPEPTTAAMGDLFLTSHLLPFELASVVLLATLVGAVVIARKELKADDEPRT